MLPLPDFGEGAGGWGGFLVLSRLNEFLGGVPPKNSFNLPPSGYTFRMRLNRIAGLLLAVVLAAGCAFQPATPPGSPTLTVLAAASLTELFTELGRLFEARNPQVKVTFNFAGSQQLAQQLNQGAGADVFASASPKNMDAVVQSGRVERGAVQNFARNRLVVILPSGRYAREQRRVRQLSDLAQPGLKLDLADSSVPAGQYSLEFLDKAALDPAFGPAFKAGVLKNVVSYEENVKAVVTKVALDEADAGIVYATDAIADSIARSPGWISPTP